MADLSLKKSVLDSLVCSGNSLILETASPRTRKPKIVNESLLIVFSYFTPYEFLRVVN